MKTIGVCSTRTTLSDFGARWDAESTVANPRDIVRRAVLSGVAADVRYPPMALEPLKDGIRSHVRIDFYGNVHKRLRGTAAAERYATEVAVLKILEQRGCPYVPRLLEEHPEEFYFVSTNCGKPASQITKEKADRIFAKLEREYGVRHLDAEPRNITYSDKMGCFCVIDFELAEILPAPTHPPEPPIVPGS